MIEISFDVVDEFNADREADEILGHAAGCLLLVRQLLVRRRGRVDNKRLGVAHIGQIRGQLQVVYESRTCSCIALDSKREYTAKSVLEVFLCELVARVARKARV